MGNDAVIHRDAYYWVWLQRALGIGYSRLPAVLSQSGSPRELYEKDRWALIRSGFHGTVLERLCEKALDVPKRIVNQTLVMGGWLLTYDDEAYPDALRQIYAPPAVLYGRGAVPNFTHAPFVSVVGTRKATDGGCLTAGYLAAGLAASGITVISGAAVGIDSAANEGALFAKAPTIAVLACGLDVEYPSKTASLRRTMCESGGTLLTEYPLGTTVTRQTFKVRNRLLSGLADGVLIVEAPKISGALMTARYALEQNRELFVVPGDPLVPQCAGSNALIKDGAVVVTDAVDMVEVLRAHYPSLSATNARPTEQAFLKVRLEKPIAKAPAAKETTKPERPSPAPRQEGRPVPPPADADETVKQIYEAMSFAPQSVEEIADKAGLPVSEALVAMTELELYGCADSLAGKQYVRHVNR